MTRRYWILISFLAALWGASYLFIEIGLRDLSPAMIVFLRTVLAALVLLPIALRRDALRSLRGRYGPIALLALVQVAAPFLLISIGQGSIASSLAGILVASAPIWTAILAVFIDQSERLHGWGLAGIGIGMAGVALLFGVDLAGSTETLVGGLLVLLAGLGYALGAFMLKRGFPEEQPIGIATATMTASAVLLAPLALATAPDEMPGLGPVAAVLALGVAGTGLAFFIFYTLIGEAGPSRASLVAYIAPGFAVIYGVTLLDEPFTFGIVAGLALIVGGSWLAAEGRVPTPARVRARREARKDAASAPPSIDAPARRAA